MWPKRRTPRRKLNAVSHPVGWRATLEDIPDAELERLARVSFDWGWFLSVWQIGPEAQQVSRSNPTDRGRDPVA